jgi:hypothetical protein
MEVSRRFRASLYEELLAKVDYSVYANKAIIIKGCSKNQL